MSLRSVFVLVVALVLIACVHPATFWDDARNVERLTEADPEIACERVLQRLKVARQMVSQIREFTWAEFAAVGVVLPPPGVCATGMTYLVEKSSVPSGLSWVPLTEKLSFRSAADNFAVACGNCLALAGQVCSSGRGLSPSDRQELWCRLGSALTGAIYLVSTHKDVVAYQIIPETESQFERSSDAVREKYANKFKARCDQYFALLDNLLYQLEGATRAVSVICGKQDEVHR